MPAVTVTGFKLAYFKTGFCRISLSLSMALRRSPSVMMPLALPSSIIMASPNRPNVITNRHSCTVESGCTVGTLVFITSLTWVRSFRPKLPPGWNTAKSEGLKSLALIKATASASPMPMVAMVEVVGARLFGQTSRSTATFKITSEFFPSVEPGLPTKLMMLQPKCLSEGKSLVTSSVSPL